MYRSITYPKVFTGQGLRVEMKNQKAFSLDTLSSNLAVRPQQLDLLFMPLPMALLYESCIWIAWFMERRRAQATRS